VSGGGDRPALTTGEALKTISGRIPTVWLAVWLAAVAVGAVGFATTVGGDAQRAWMSVWSNFLFWTAISMAGVVFGAVLQVAKGHWGKSFRRLAEAAGAFLPISFALFFVLRLGAEHVFPWIGPVETSHMNRDWLTLEGVFMRNGVLLAVLYLLGFVWLFYSIRARRWSPRRTGAGARPSFPSSPGAGAGTTWRSSAAEAASDGCPPC